jgi:hypothetical protein
MAEFTLGQQGRWRFLLYAPGRIPHYPRASVTSAIRVAGFLRRYVAGACRPRVRYTVGRDTENSSAKSLIE